LKTLIHQLNYYHTKQFGRIQTKPFIKESLSFSLSSFFSDSQTRTHTPLLFLFFVCFSSFSFLISLLSHLISHFSFLLTFLFSFISFLLYSFKKVVDAAKNRSPKRNEKRKERKEGLLCDTSHKILCQKLLFYSRASFDFAQSQWVFLLKRSD